MRLNPKFAALALPLTLALQGCSSQAPDSPAIEGAKATLVGNSNTCETAGTFADGDFADELRGVLNITDPAALQAINTRGIRICLDADLGTKQNQSLLSSRLVAAFSHTGNTLYLAYDPAQQHGAIFTPGYGGLPDTLEQFANDIANTSKKDGIAGEVSCVSFVPCSSIKWGTEEDFPKSVARNRDLLPL